MFDIELKVKNYKCFHDKNGFERICRVNLIVGRNNAGKTSLLDLISVSTEYNTTLSSLEGNLESELFYKTSLTEQHINTIFGTDSEGTDELEYGQQFLNRKVELVENARRQTTCIEYDDSGISPKLSAKENRNYPHLITRVVTNPLEGYKFVRLLAERDILSEESTSELIIHPNGMGVTNAIQKFITQSTLPSNLVNEDMLEAINEVFSPDITFTAITCQQHQDKKWEIFLNENNKGEIALSQSGSGLKTVICVLSYLILLPHLHRNNLENHIFAFEELENSLHPALLRKLNDYIYKKAVENNFIYFLTTHSSVLIDQFSKQNDAQIIHLTQQNGITTCTTAKTYFENNGILDDLDVRASDLLQANGIIWVEGPSDRIYLNKWIDLWSNGSLKEGSQYQIIFYGGRLLSHLSADVPEDVDASISILNTNRNALIVIDSDKNNLGDSINSTKTRIQDEFTSFGGKCWITQGKEIENYTPSKIVDELWGQQESTQVGEFESFFDYLNNIVDDEGTKYKRKKPLLAEKLAPYMTVDNLKNILDLDEKMNLVCEAITEWNS